MHPPSLLIRQTNMMMMSMMMMPNAFLAQPNNMYGTPTGTVSSRQAEYNMQGGGEP